MNSGQEIKKDGDASEKAIVEEVLADFKRRQDERRKLERGWQLNMKFVRGEQYCDVNRLGEIEEGEKDFY